MILRSYLLIKAELSVCKCLLAVSFKLLYVNLKLPMFHNGVLCILTMEQRKPLTRTLQSTKISSGKQKILNKHRYTRNIFSNESQIV